MDINSNWDDILNEINKHIPPPAPQSSIKQKHTTIFDKSNLKIGWICPKCGAINSPSLQQCTCNKQTTKDYIKCEYTNCNNKATFQFHEPNYSQFSDVSDSYCCSKHLIELLPTTPTIVTKLNEYYYKS